jgi:hypothetical protein
MKTPHELKRLFYDKEFIGAVLRCSTLLEADLDVLLCLFYCRKARVKDALEKLMPELSFHAKIEMLTAIPIRKNTRSYTVAIGRLRAFRRVRNIVSHQWTTSTVEVEKLCKNGEIAAILDGYPEVMESEFANCRRALGRLAQTREFRLEDGKHFDAYARWSLTIDKVFD